MFRNAEYEAKIAAIQEEFNALANEERRGRSPEKGMLKQAARF